jgi:hypothetical protein
MHPLAATQLRRKAREIKAMAARLRDSGRVNMAQLESAYADGILHAVRVFASGQSLSGIEKRDASRKKRQAEQQREAKACTTQN